MVNLNEIPMNEYMYIYIFIDIYIYNIFINYIRLTCIYTTKTNVYVYVYIYIQSMNHTQISILCSYPTLRSKAYNKFAISWIYFNSLTNPATNWNIQLERPPSDELLPPQRSVQTCSQRLTNSNHKVQKMTHVQHIWLNPSSRR